jgi:hypothetical protein
MFPVEPSATADTAYNRTASWRFMGDLRGDPAFMRGLMQPTAAGLHPAGVPPAAPLR